jgi:hypothetical protein
MNRDDIGTNFRRHNILPLRVDNTTDQSIRAVSGTGIYFRIALDNPTDSSSPSPLKSPFFGIRIGGMQGGAH